MLLAKIKIKIKFKFIKLIKARYGLKNAKKSTKY